MGPGLDNSKGFLKVDFMGHLKRDNKRTTLEALKENSFAGGGAMTRACFKISIKKAI